jgi:hypothetical protein
MNDRVPRRMTDLEPTHADRAYARREREPAVGRNPPGSSVARPG